MTLFFSLKLLAIFTAIWETRHAFASILIVIRYPFLFLAVRSLMYSDFRQNGINVDKADLIIHPVNVNGHLV